jgi:hypothetical protein
MTSVSLGENSKMIVRPSTRDTIQRFFGEVLGCRVIKKPDADIIRLGSDFYLGVVYEDLR